MSDVFTAFFLSYRRKKDDQVEGYLDYDDDDDYVGGDTKRGVIDRVKGRRLKKGWSTVCVYLSRTK